MSYWGRPHPGTTPSCSWTASTRWVPMGGREATPHHSDGPCLPTTSTPRPRVPGWFRAELLGPPSEPLPLPSSCPILLEGKQQIQRRLAPQGDTTHCTGAAWRQQVGVSHPTGRHLEGQLWPPHQLGQEDGEGPGEPRTWSEKAVSLHGPRFRDPPPGSRGADSCPVTCLGWYKVGGAGAGPSASITTTPRQPGGPDYGHAEAERQEEPGGSQRKAAGGQGSGQWSKGIL